MIILQAAGGDISLTFDGAQLLGDSPFLTHATTYRDNSYIHRLNRTLQSEMRAISTYRSLQLSLGSPLALEMTADFDCYLSEHQDAGKELVRLIVLNRGIPEDRSILSLHLTGTFLQICSRVPSRLFVRVTLSTLAQVERHLLVQYDRLMQEAPGRDIEALSLLRSGLRKRIDGLKIAI